MLLSWFVYVPIYLSILRRRSPDLYRKLGGRPVLGAKDLFYLLIYLRRRDYLVGGDTTVSRHSRTLAMTLFGGLVVGVGGAVLRYLVGM